jgi:hypothetical protein
MVLTFAAAAAVPQVLELVRCPAVRNRDLYVLAHSPLQLQSLTLGDDTNRPWVTNRGLVSIGHMCTLQQLALHDCNSITNNGLTCLAGLASLVSLSLRGCRKITNNGLEVLAALTGLSSLNLYGCSRISDLGVPLLEGLPLQALSLGGTRVRDEGVAHLVRHCEAHSHLAFCHPFPFTGCLCPTCFMLHRGVQLACAAQRDLKSAVAH